MKKFAPYIYFFLLLGTSVGSGYFILAKTVNIDTGKITVPDPRRLLPAEFILNGRFLDRITREPIASMEFTLSVGQVKLLEARTARNRGLRLMYL